MRPHLAEHGPDRRVCPQRLRGRPFSAVALHGLMDAGEFDRLEELFADDLVYDLVALAARRAPGHQPPRVTLRRRPSAGGATCPCNAPSGPQWKNSSSHGRLTSA